MATSKKSVRKLSTTVKFTARLQAPAPRRQAARFCIPCQMGQHCGSCPCCRGHNPRPLEAPAGVQPRFVQGNLEVF